MACKHQDTEGAGEDGRGETVEWCRDCGALSNGDQPPTWTLPRVAHDVAVYRGRRLLSHVEGKALDVPIDLGPADE